MQSEQMFQWAGKVGLTIVVLQKVLRMDCLVECADLPLQGNFQPIKLLLAGANWEMLGLC